METKNKPSNNHAGRDRFVGTGVDENERAGLPVALVGPAYHGVFADFSTTLSPLSAEIGMKVTSTMLSRREANSRKALII